MLIRSFTANILWSFIQESVSATSREHATYYTYSIIQLHRAYSTKDFLRMGHSSLFSYGDSDCSFVQGASWSKLK